MVSSDQQMSPRRRVLLLPVSSGERSLAGAEGPSALRFSGNRFLPNLIEAGKPNKLPQYCTASNKFVKVQLR
jgi:hypothetical protein